MDAWPGHVVASPDVEDLLTGQRFPLVLKKVHPKVRNHGEGLLLVESGYYRFHI